MFWGISTLVQTEVQKKRRRHQTFLFRGRGDSWIYSSCSWRRVGLNKRQEGTGNWKQAAWKQVLFYHSAMFNLFLFLLKTHDFPMPLSVFFLFNIFIKNIILFYFWRAHKFVQPIRILPWLRLHAWLRPNSFVLLSARPWWHFLNQ